jgi:hypothetical protein
MTTVDYGFNIPGMPDTYNFTKDDEKYFPDPIHPDWLQDDRYIDKSLMPSLKAMIGGLRALQHTRPDWNGPSAMLDTAEFLLRTVRLRRSPILTGKVTGAADRKLANELNALFDQVGYYLWSASKALRAKRAN